MDIISSPCQFLQWDTDFFGYRIARILSSRLTPELTAQIEAWSQKNAIQCLYLQAESNDPQTILLAEKHGYSLVEVRLTFERNLKDWDPATRAKATQEVAIRAGCPEDIPAIQDVAQNSYVDSRFYFDQHFGEQEWQRYYRAWAEKSFSGGAEMLLVAEKDGEVLGFITGVIVNEGKECQYELTGVRESARRFGVGQELFRSGMDWCVQHGIPYIWVMTQGRNVTTQRMIQRHGFLTRSCHLYYHKWFTEPHIASAS
jgi:dTDP-4-amino-4,6-dideoxy-D-galactose acyltransferase